MTTTTIDTRTELEVAANAVWLLRNAHALVPKANRDEYLTDVVGVSAKDLALAAHRAQRDGPDALRPRDVLASTGEPPAPAPRAPQVGHPGEKLCARCGEWLPVERFGPRRPGDPRPHKMCEICLGEFERDHFVAIRKARPLRQVVAYFTATSGDALVGRTCVECGEPFELGACVTLTAYPIHAKCPKVDA